jgi:hypothetical protein
MLAGAGLGIGAAFAAPAAAQAGTIEVDNLGDAGAGACVTGIADDCSLRSAIDTANGVSGHDLITFRSGLSGTITIDPDLPTITEAVTIEGPGADVLTIDGAYFSRAFHLRTGTPGDLVTISDLTMIRGSSSQSVVNANYGGTILNENATLRLVDSAITGSTADDGGAIYSGCDDACGQPDGAGDTANTIVRRSTLSGNEVIGTAGAIYFNYGAGTVDRSTLSGNEASRGGAAIGLYDTVGPVRIENSTITGNTVTADLTIHGAAVNIFQNSGGVTISNSTVAGNIGDDNSGGVFFFNFGGDPNPRIENSIVADNTASSNPDIGAANSGVFDVAFDLIEDPGTADLNGLGGNQLNVDPQLGSLDDFGGPTQTMLPGADGPAIDNGSAFGVSLDQRGRMRPFDVPAIADADDGSDIGAVELQGVPTCLDVGVTTAHNTAADVQLDCTGPEDVVHEIVAGPANGSISGFDPDTGELTYTPNAGFSGSDSFTYRGIGEAASAPQTVTIDVAAAPPGSTDALATSCRGEAATIAGTAGGETLVGTPGADVIAAGGGDDLVRGLGGRDLICADEGDDAVRAGSGADSVHGGNGNDLLRGSKGSDSLRGDEGGDRLFGQGGADRLFGGGRGAGGATDGCFGGPGADSARGCDERAGVP